MTLYRVILKNGYHNHQKFSIRKRFFRGPIEEWVNTDPKKAVIDYMYGHAQAISLRISNIMKSTRGLREESIKNPEKEFVIFYHNGFVISRNREDFQE